MNVPYAETGISSRIPFRKMFDSYDDIVRDINKYKTYANCYNSIYWFRERETKYSGKIGPNYETAIINRVVLDIDSYEKTSTNKGKDKFESYSPRGLQDIRKLEEWGSEKNLLREYRFSGGGLYAIFSAIGHPLKLRDFEINLQNEIDIRIDISTIGDTARMMRATNSFNFKKYRMCFCIPLKKEELYLSFGEIKKLASNPRVGERYIYGEKTEDFSNCKIDKNKIKLKNLRINFNGYKKEDANKILLKYGWEVEDLCDTIKGIISLDHVGNALRFELLKYFKTIVKVKYEDSVGLLISLLGTEGIHSAIEGQAKYVYASDKQFNPEWKLKQLGFCPLDCYECSDRKKLIWEVIRNENNVVKRKEELC